MPDETSGPPNHPEFEAIQNGVNEIIQKFKQNAKTGWAGLFSFLYSATSEMIELAEVAEGLVKTAKKETVIAGFKYAYKQVDPDLPWIPEPFETKIEEWILDNSLPIFIDWLVKVYNDKGIFKHA